MTTLLNKPQIGNASGTVVLNGATPVSVSFATITAGSVVVMSRTTSGGTPGINPLVTITAGVGFDVTGIAADTSTYTYAVFLV